MPDRLPFFSLRIHCFSIVHSRPPAEPLNNRPSLAVFFFLKLKGNLKFSAGRFRRYSLKIISPLPRAGFQFMVLLLTGCVLHTPLSTFFPIFFPSLSLGSHKRPNDLSPPHSNEKYLYLSVHPLPSSAIIFFDLSSSAAPFALISGRWKTRSFFLSLPPSSSRVHVHCCP